MIESNEPAVQLLLGQYMARGGDEHAVVLVVDTRDAVGGELAKIVDPEGHAERMAGRTMIPTALLVVPRVQIARGLESSHPRISEALGTRLPAGRIPIVCIGFGGMTLVGIPRRRLSATATA